MLQFILVLREFNQLLVKGTHIRWALVICKSQLGLQETLAFWLTSALSKLRRNNLGRSTSLLHAGIAPVLILHQPAATLPHKILKHHPCPRETPLSLKLRTNNENPTLSPKGNTNKSKPDRGYPTQGPSHQWAKKDGLSNTDGRNVPGVDVILSHHWKKVRLEPEKTKRKQVSQKFSQSLEQFGHIHHRRSPRYRVLEQKVYAHKDRIHLGQTGPTEITRTL